MEHTERELSEIKYEVIQFFEDILKECFPLTDEKNEKELDLILLRFQVDKNAIVATLKYTNKKSDEDEEVVKIPLVSFDDEGKKIIDLVTPLSVEKRNVILKEMKNDFVLLMQKKFENILNGV